MDDNLNSNQLYYFGLDPMDKLMVNTYEIDVLQGSDDNFLEVYCISDYNGRIDFTLGHAETGDYFFDEITCSSNSPPDIDSFSAVPKELLAGKNVSWVITMYSNGDKIGITILYNGYVIYKHDECLKGVISNAISFMVQQNINQDKTFVMNSRIFSVKRNKSKIYNFAVILLTITAAIQNEVTLTYETVCGLYFMVVILVATVVNSGEKPNRRIRCYK